MTISGEMFTSVPVMAWLRLWMRMRRMFVEKSRSESFSKRFFSTRSRAKARITMLPAIRSWTLLLIVDSSSWTCRVVARISPLNRRKKNTYRGNVERATSVVSTSIRRRKYITTTTAAASIQMFVRAVPTRFCASWMSLIRRVRIAPVLFRWKNDADILRMR